MRALFKKELKENFLKSLVETILLSGIAVTLIPFGYKLLGTMEIQIPGIAQRYGGLLEKLKDLNFFVTTQWFGKNLLELAILFAVINGIGIISGEYERKSSIFLFSRPVSRKAILCTKLSVAVFYTLIPIAISTFVILLLAETIPQNLNFVIFFKLLVEALFATALTTVISGTVSIVVNDRVKGGLVLIAGIIGLVTLSKLQALHFLNYSLLFMGNFVRSVTISCIGIVLLLILSIRLINLKEF